MGGERRKHPRVTVLPADLRVTHAQPYVVVAIVDMSMGGMRIEVAGGVPKFGDLLDITMAWPSGSATLNAMVRHVTPKPGGDPASARHLVGVEFDDPDLIETLAGEWMRRALADDEKTPTR